MERICFQVEEAQWFYEDFIRPLDPSLPSMSLRQFALRIFQHCPLMAEWSPYHHSAAFSEFLAYKTRVPVRGAILLNEAMDEIVLVKGWKKGASWSFPRGKINKDEKDLDCAIREVYEETGYDINAAGLADDEDRLKYIEIPMREQNMRLYVIRGVRKDVHFEPRTRKEISKIEWYNLSELPTLKKKAALAGQSANGPANKFYMVAPFLGPLRKWISQQKKLDIARNPSLAEPEPEHANGKSPSVEPQLPSDLPEMSNPEDASLHLKRLLNIGAAPITPQGPRQQPSGDALLSLLRQGSEGFGEPELARGPPAPVSFHPDKGTSHPLPQSFNWQSSLPSNPTANPPPGFGPQPPMGMSPGQPYPGNVGNGFNQPYGYGPGNRMYPSQTTSYPPPPINQHPGYRPPPQMPFQMPPQSLPRIPTTMSGHPNPQQMSFAPTQPPRQAPAPYQRTGDPEFAELDQGTNANHPSVPPASKLPLPKLTSHSMALLNVFKGDVPKKNEPAWARSQPAIQPQRVAIGDMADNQNDLLKLLKKQQPKHSTAAPIPTARAELAGTPTPPPAVTKVEPVRILRKETPSRPPAATRETKPVPRQGEATVRGPLNLPNFEAAKSSRRQPSHSPKNANAPKVPHRVKVPNITILPRPQQEKKESPVPSTAVSPAPAPVPEAPAPRPGQARNVRLSDLAKPFQPKILRRPEKGNIETYLPSHTVTVSAFSQPNKDGEESKEPEAPKDDRRPSQPATQKETLLSLFGKAASPGPGLETSAPPSRNSELGPESDGQRSIVSPLPTSPPRSAMISPLEGWTSSPQVQPSSSSAKPTPPPVEASEPTKAKATSAGDKAFLLGYLQGVAKGKR